MRRSQIATGIAMFFAITGCSYEHVDLAPARGVADAYYSALKANDEARAKSQFSPAFKQQTESWPRLIHLYQVRGGPVVSSELQAASLVAHEDDPCFFLTYRVKRTGPMTGTEESMLVCRSPGPAQTWAITGHAIKRLDNGDIIRAGLLPDEVSVQL